MTEKRFDYIVEACKQILSLSSGGLVLVTTFKDKFYSNNHLPWPFFLFFAFSLLSLALSLICILTTAGTIEVAIDAKKEPRIYNPILRSLFFAMLISYLISLISLGIAAFQTIN